MLFKWYLIRHLHGQWVSSTIPVMPANVLPALCILPSGRFLAITLQLLPIHLSAMLTSVIRAVLGPSEPKLHPYFLPLSSCPFPAHLSWVSISSSGWATIECRPPEVRQQRWYLTEHSECCRCQSKVNPEQRKPGKLISASKKKIGAAMHEKSLSSWVRLVNILRLCSL